MESLKESLRGVTKISLTMTREKRTHNREILTILKLKRHLNNSPSQLNNFCAISFFPFFSKKTNKVCQMSKRAFSIGTDGDRPLIHNVMKQEESLPNLTAKTD